MELTPSQVEQYHEEGYLSLENVLESEDDLGPVIRSGEDEVDRQCE